MSDTHQSDKYSKWKVLLLRRETRKVITHCKLLLVVTNGFETSGREFDSWDGSRTFQDFALTRPSRRLYKGASHFCWEHGPWDIHDGTHAAKGGGLLWRDTRKGTTHRFAATDTLTYKPKRFRRDTRIGTTHRFAATDTLTYKPKRFWYRLSPFSYGSVWIRTMSDLGIVNYRRTSISDKIKHR
jgi:hypothetical protein